LSNNGSSNAADPAADPADEVALLRTLCAVWWPAGGGPVSVHPADDRAAGALTTLNLARSADRLA
jgi:hypothetical protein